MLDEGEGTPVLLLPGKPTWSYLWRDTIGPLLAAGHQVLVPDLCTARSGAPVPVGVEVAALPERFVPPADATVNTDLAWPNVERNSESRPSPRCKRRGPS